MKKRKLFAGGLLAAVVASAVSVGAASSLQLTYPTHPYYTVASKCSTQEADVTIRDGAATLTIPDGCEEDDLALYLGQGDTAERFQVSKGSNTVNVGEVSPEGALLTADTWPLSTKWTLLDPPEPGDSPVTCQLIPSGECEVTDLSLTSWGWPETDTYIVFGKVVSSVEKPTLWKITINLSDDYFPFEANGLWALNQGVVRESDSGCDAQPRTITLTGTTEWGQHQYTWAGAAPRPFQVQGQLTDPNGPGAPILMSCF